MEAAKALTEPEGATGLPGGKPNLVRRITSATGSESNESESDGSATAQSADRDECDGCSRESGTRRDDSVGHSLHSGSISSIEDALDEPERVAKQHNTHCPNTVESGNVSHNHELECAREGSDEPDSDAGVQCEDEEHGECIRPGSDDIGGGFGRVSFASDVIGTGSSHRARNASAMSQYSISDSWGGELGTLPAFARTKMRLLPPACDADVDEALSEPGQALEDSLHSSEKHNGNHTKGTPPLRWWCFVMFYIMQSFGSLIFLHWLLSGAWNTESPATSALYFCAEVIAFISSSISLFTGLFWRKDEDPTPTQRLLTEEKPHVAVCLCRYKEPVEDLFVSLGCMLDIDWPAEKLHIYILDDGFYYQDQEKQETQMEELAHFVPGASKLRSDVLSSFQLQREGDLFRADCATSSHSWNVRLLNRKEKRCEVTLIARKKPSISHYKAGNINSFLYNYLGKMTSRGDEPIELMLLLDHDMMPDPGVLNETIPAFDREDLAFVQCPQRFFDIVTEDRFCAGNEIFFDGVCENRSHVGLAAFAGTNAVWRLSSLYAIGGMQYGSVTEDANTGFAAHRRGYSSEYIAKDLCVGQSPQNLPDAMRQRMRWSQGSIEMILHFCKSICFRSKPFPCPQVLVEAYNLSSNNLPRLSCGRSVVLALVYLESLIYPFYALGLILHTIVCILYLVDAQSPMAPPEPLHILLYWLPLYVVKALCQHLAFPLVTMRVHLDAQRAWAGYSLTTIWSIFQAFGLGASGWFNTGGASKNRFLLQYGNTVIFLAIMVALIYRAVAFTFFEDSCEAWMTVGALLYSFIFLCLLKEWALMPFTSSTRSTEAMAIKESVPMEISTGQSDDINLQRQDSSFSVAMRDSVRTKASRLRSKADDDSVGSSSVGSFVSLLSGVDSGAETEISRIRTNFAQTRIRQLISQREEYERHSPNVTVVVNLVSVMILTSVIFVWNVQLNDSSRWSSC